VQNKFVFGDEMTIKSRFNTKSSLFFKTITGLSVAAQNRPMFALTETKDVGFETRSSIAFIFVSR